MTKFLSVTLAVAGIGLASAPIAAATPADDAYLTTIKAQGVPIYGAPYVIQLGHNVCDAARQYPSMNVVDLAFQEVTSENEARAYQWDEARVIVTSALANYCPGSIR
jgi:Protein of unknown function (DUF732)